MQTKYVAAAMLLFLNVAVAAEPNEAGFSYSFEPNHFEHAERIEQMKEGLLQGKIKFFEQGKPVADKAPSSPSEFIIWATKGAATEKKLNADLLTAMASLWEQPVEKAAPFVPLEREPLPGRLQRCARKSLPYVRAVLGALQKSDRSQVAEKWVKLAVVSGTPTGQLRAGALPCGQLVGLGQADTLAKESVTVLGKHAMTLAVFANLEAFSDTAKQQIIFSFVKTTTAQKAVMAQGEQSFWREYWSYLQLESVLRQNSQFMDPVAFARFTKADVDESTLLQAPAAPVQGN